MSLKVIQGDLFDQTHNFQVLLHGCNCFHTMGAGIAKVIKANFPEAYNADKYLSVYGDKNKLGDYTAMYIQEKKITVLNLYTQYEPGANFELKHLVSCFEKIKQSKFKNKRIGMPCIGAGIGGGNWEEIQEALEGLCVDLDVTVVKL